MNTIRLKKTQIKKQALYSGKGVSMFVEEEKAPAEIVIVDASLYDALVENRLAELPEEIRRKVGDMGDTLKIYEATIKDIIKSITDLNKTLGYEH